jgi:hypothetical protein
MIALYAGVQNTFNGPIAIDADLKCPLGVYATGNLIVVMYQIGTEVQVSVYHKELGMQLVHVYGDESYGSRQWTRFSKSEQTSMVTLSDVEGIFSHVYIRPWDGKFFAILFEIPAPRPDNLLSDQNARCLLVKSIIGKNNGFLRPPKEEFIALWSISNAAPPAPPKPPSVPTSHPTPTSKPTAAPTHSPLKFARRNNETCLLQSIHFTYDPKTDETEILDTFCIPTDPKVEIVDGDLIRLNSETFGMVFTDAAHNLYSAYYWTGGEREEVEEAEPLFDGESFRDFTQYRFTDKTVMKHIGVGSSPRFNSAGSQDGVIALVLGDSFCSNNQEFNKRAGPAMICETAPYSMKGVITYTIGYSKYWIELFKRPGKKLSACDPHLLHGAMDLGSCPVVALSALDVFTGEMQLIEVHRTADDLKDRTCAVSKWQKSLVLNKFSFFTGYSLFDKLKRRNSYGLRLLLQ